MKDKKEECKVISVQVIGGTQADVYEIGKAMQEFTKKLPFRLEALITTDNIKLCDVDVIIKEFIKLRKQIKTDEGFKK